MGTSTKKSTDNSPATVIEQSAVGTHSEEPFTISQEELSISDIPSPPYRPTASSSNLRFLLPDGNNSYTEYPPTPIYRHNSSMETESMGENQQRIQKEEMHLAHEKQKPFVHYSENVRPSHAGMRQDSDFMSSRAASLAGPEDGDSEDYDWSAEEDLVDEEVKFEKQMGVKDKPRGWGLRR